MILRAWLDMAYLVHENKYQLINRAYKFSQPDKHYFDIKVLKDDVRHIFITTYYVGFISLILKIRVNTENCTGCNNIS